MWGVYGQEKWVPSTFLGVEPVGVGLEPVEDGGGFVVKVCGVDGDALFFEGVFDPDAANGALSEWCEIGEAIVEEGEGVDLLQELLFGAMGARGIDGGEGNAMALKAFLSVIKSGGGNGGNDFETPAICLQGFEEVCNAWVEILVLEACLEGVEDFGDFVVGNAEAMGESEAWGENGDGAFKREGGAFGEEVGAGTEDVVGVEDKGWDGHG